LDLDATGSSGFVGFIVSGSSVYLFFYPVPSFNSSQNSADWCLYFFRGLIEIVGYSDADPHFVIRHVIAAKNQVAAEND